MVFKTHLFLKSGANTCMRLLKDFSKNNDVGGHVLTVLAKYVCSFFAGFNWLHAIVFIVRGFFYYFLFDGIRVFEFLDGHHLIGCFE